MNTSIDQSNQISTMLHDLGIPVRRHGYRQLCIGIPFFATDKTQTLTKELYPYISKKLGFTNGYAVERSIRGVISDAWSQRNPDVWNSYFPNHESQPTNKEFIATLAEHLE